MSETEKILNDIRAYLRINAAAALRPVAATVIDSQEKAKVYEKLSEGKTQPMIEAETGIPQRTISDWVGKFTEAGLVTPPNEHERVYRALFTLRELGINTAGLRTRKKKELVSEGKKALDGKQTVNKQLGASPN